MQKFFILLVLLTTTISGCEELSFKDDKKPVTVKPEEPDNDDGEGQQLDLTDTTPLVCEGSYAIGISQVENVTTNVADPELLKIVDKNKVDSSTWFSGDTPQTLVFQLNQKSLLKDFVISWHNQDVSHYFDIESSLDKETWVPLLTNQQSKPNYIIAERLRLNDASQTAHFIKLTLNGNNLNNRSDIVEFEAFGCHQDTSHDIELIDWYLSVQTDEDGNGKSDSIKETTLANGYEDPRFFYVGEDGGLVFSSTVQGYRTSTNTKYVRSELREMLRRGNSSHKTQGVNKNNWVFSTAPSQDLTNAGGVDGTLDVDVAVNHVTSTGESYQIGRVIIGQIHANDDEPVRLYYRKLPNNTNGSIYIAHEYLEGDDTYYEILGSRDNDADNPTDGIPLDEKFSYQIKVEGNELTVTITKQSGESYVQVVDMSNSGYDVGGQYMYFKAGVYNQNNSGDLHDYVQATFYKIDNQHQGYQ